MLISIYLASKYNLKRFSMYIWLFSGAICLIWEVALFTAGARTYSFTAVAEIIYHGVTEAGPGLIIMLIAAYRLGIIDLDEFKDHRYKHPIDCDGDCEICDNLLC